MSNKRPFDHDTLKLRAIFVPENHPNRLSAANARSQLGADPLKIPAIFVPEGSNAQRPGHPYVHVGRYAMDKDQANKSDGSKQEQDAKQSGSWASGSNLSTEDGDDAEQQATLPMPPTPAVVTSQRYSDPVTTAVAAWRRASGTGTGQTAPTPAPGTIEVARIDEHVPGPEQDAAEPA